MRSDGREMMGECVRRRRKKKKKKKKKKKMKKDIYSVIQLNNRMRLSHARGNQSSILMRFFD
jgi:hypothetical protein